jgi:hypothetical protein
VCDEGIVRSKGRKSPQSPIYMRNKKKVIYVYNINPISLPRILNLCNIRVSVFPEVEECFPSAIMGGKEGSTSALRILPL